MNTYWPIIAQSSTSMIMKCVLLLELENWVIGNPIFIQSCGIDFQGRESYLKGFFLGGGGGVFW